MKIFSSLSVLISASAEDRNIHLTGAPNSRDLGGMINADGKKVKSGLLIRSDKLGTLTDTDLKKLSDMSVCTVIDFRTEDERKNLPNKNPTSTTKMEIIDVLSSNLDVMTKDLLYGIYV